MKQFIDWISAHLLPCTYKQWMGFSCPCCGFQRSVLALINGDFVQSVMLYPALLPSIASLLIFPFVKRDKRRKYLICMFISDAAIAIAGCIMKNAGLLPD